MDIYSYLKKDHRLVADLMETLLTTENAQQRKTLFEQIKMELTLHADTEEVTFYKAIEDATGSKKIHQKMEHADEEHDEVREYLQKLSDLAIESEQWMEQFGEFKHAVTHHVKEEEEEIFKQAQQYLTEEQALSLAKEMHMLKQQQKKEMMAA